MPDSVARLSGLSQVSQLRKSPPRANEHRVSLTAWLALSLAVVATFVAFMTLDPDPSLLLSICSAANVGIFLVVLYRLYEWQLLLSPVSLFAVGPAMFVYYTVGNLGARIAGPLRHTANPGSLAYYPLAALLSTVGLLLFCLVVFVLLQRQFRYQRYRYTDLDWQPWQAVGAAVVAIAVMLYLSLQYEFVGGYFRDVERDLDSWLASAYPFFVTLSVIVGVSVTAKRGPTFDKLIGAAAVALTLVAALATRSRTFMLVLAILVTLCWVTLRPRQARLALVVAGVLGIGLYVLGSVVKINSVSGRSRSMSENLGVVVEAIVSRDLQSVAEANRLTSETDAGYRIAGLEYPAALLFTFDHGTEPMYGQGLVGGFVQALPGFVRPETLDSRIAAISEGSAISAYFVGRGLLYDDSIGIPLVSGLADWGTLLSPLIYVAIAVYCLIVWRVAQLSPTLFVAYLLIWTRADPADLFWDDGLFAVRALVFAWLALKLLGFVLMPRWRPPASTGSAAVQPAGFRLGRAGFEG
jgi:hypothetical protein